MKNTAANHNRRFQRWAQGATAERRHTLQLAVDSLLPVLEAAGFRCVERSFDCGDVPRNTLNMERERIAGQIDFVVIIFDQYMRAQFQIFCGTKTKSKPHSWVGSGALVWKKKSEALKFKWWGAKWWQIDEEGALRDAVATVALLLPQLLNFLDDGYADRNIWPVVIP